MFKWAVLRIWWTPVLGFSFFFKVESTRLAALANAQEVVTSRVKPLRVVSNPIFIDCLCYPCQLQSRHNRSYRCGHRHRPRSPKDDNGAQLAPCRYLGWKGGDRLWRSWAPQGFLWTQLLRGIFGREWRVSLSMGWTLYISSSFEKKCCAEFQLELISFLIHWQICHLKKSITHARASTCWVMFNQ